MDLHVERLDIANRFVCLSDGRVLSIAGFLDAWEEVVDDPEIAEFAVLENPGRPIRVVIWAVPKVVIH